MSLKNTHTFSIDAKTNPETQRPFGSKYAGEFTVRRPTILDNQAIDLRDAATLNAFGPVNPGQLSTDTTNLNFIFTNLAVIGEKKPDWFDMSKLYAEGEDKQAVYAVWAEVDGFLKSFRSAPGGKDGGDGGEKA